jgi:UDP-2,3-diacylglucosamine pyrophosphatase LpxH
MEENFMESWHEKALAYAAQNLSLKEIARRIEDEFGLVDMYQRVRCYIYDRLKRNKKEDVVKPEETKRVAIQNQEPKYHTSKWDGTKVLKFAIMGDTQIGSKYTQLTYLHEFYDLCEREGIKHVYHTGDLTDGLKMRTGHEYELYEVSADDMRDDVVKNYPKREGITTYFITGNHDASIYRQVGYDIGQAIANQRPDMRYLGRDCAVVNLTPNCKLELRHPWDGTAYALSYKLQKMIEAMESDSKPNILAVGHYHKAEYIFYRNVHALQTGCFQGQTPFTRGKGISVHMGGWLVTIHVDENGYIQRFAPEFIPCYYSIKDDYKNFTR